MENYNLDINNYSINELEKILKLSLNYKEIDIKEKKNKLVNMVKESNILDNKKENIYIFLDNIQNKLISNLIKKEAIISSDLKLTNDFNKTSINGNHFVLENKNDFYGSILENNKKIDRSIIKYAYTIDSFFRPNYDDINIRSHDYIINLPETITNAITMTISSIQIPLTYYNISEELNNNIFSIEVRKKDEFDNYVIDDTFDIILTNGLYESIYTSSTQKRAQNIVDEINRQLSNVTASDPLIQGPAETISNYLSFSINLKSGNGFFTYKNGLIAEDASYNLRNNTQIYINFDVNNPNSKTCIDNQIYQRLGWQLGFRQNNIILDNSNVLYSTYIEGSQTYEIASVISDTICAIQYPRYLYLAINDYQNSSRNYFSVASDSIIAPNIIAKINILSLLEDKTAYKSGSAPGDFLYQQKHIREYFGPTNIKKLRITLIDEFGRPFSINNMDWNFVATWECLYN